MDKLDEISKTLGDRVFDVIGELLKLNDVNLEQMLRDAAYDPKNIDEYLDEIERIDPARLQEYERATGIALAKSYVDLTRIRGEDWRSQERRLMPEYVEGYFLRAARRPGSRWNLAPMDSGEPSPFRSPSDPMTLPPSSASGVPTPAI